MEENYSFEPRKWAAQFADRIIEGTRHTKPSGAWMFDYILPNESGVHTKWSLTFPNEEAELTLDQRIAMFKREHPHVEIVSDAVTDLVVEITTD